MTVHFKPNSAVCVSYVRPYEQGIQSKHGELGYVVFNENDGTPFHPLVKNHFPPAKKKIMTGGINLPCFKHPHSILPWFNISHIIIPLNPLEFPITIEASGVKGDWYWLVFLHWNWSFSPFSVTNHTSISVTFYQNHHEPHLSTKN